MQRGKRVAAAGEERRKLQRPASEERRKLQRPADDATRCLARWSEMKLKPGLFQGIIAMGFERPSAIQQRAIVPIVKGRDVVCQSQSGTGKTAVFCIASLQVANEVDPHLQVIIISPTRELAEQTGRILATLGDYLKLSTKTCVGGKSLKEEKKALGNPQIISATSSRVYDLSKRGLLDISRVSLLVLDECDEIISSGQETIVRDLIRDLPSGIQVVLVSATVGDSMRDLASELLVDPINVLIKREDTSLKNIDQFVTDCASDVDKFELLVRIFDGGISVSQSIIFCNTRKKCEDVYKTLKRKGFSSLSMMHGEMTQKERDFVMSQFRNGTRRILITTDVLGRGIDVQQVSLVVNFDLPISKELYIHRIGRSGRWGRKGIAINLCTKKERNTVMAEIETFFKLRVPPLPQDLSSLN